MMREIWIQGNNNDLETLHLEYIEYIDPIKCHSVFNFGLSNGARSEINTTFKMKKHPVGDLPIRKIEMTYNNQDYYLTRIRFFD